MSAPIHRNKNSNTSRWRTGQFTGGSFSIEGRVTRGPLYHMRRFKPWEGADRNTLVWNEHHRRAETQRWAFYRFQSVCREEINDGTSSAVKALRMRDCSKTLHTSSNSKCLSLKKKSTSEGSQNGEGAFVTPDFSAVHSLSQLNVWNGVIAVFCVGKDGVLEITPPIEM